MLKYSLIGLVFYGYLWLPIACPAQDMKAYEGAWKGELTDATSLSFTVTIQRSTGNHYSLTVSNQQRQLIRRDFSANTEHVTINLNDQISFKGKIDEQTGVISGFMHSGMLLYHQSLKETAEGLFSGKWNICMVDRFVPSALYLSVEEAVGEQYVAYPFFDDQRFSGTWAGSFAKKRDTLFFQDAKTGIAFEGLLRSDKIVLTIILAGEPLTSIELRRHDEPFPVTYDYPTEPSYFPAFREMEDSIKAGNITNTHSVLIARSGKLIYEKYFSGFTASIPHDQRSASKSISSAIAGIAMDQGLIKDTQQKLYDLLPAEYQHTKESDERKAGISLHSLLTMSSGIDAVDFGTNRLSEAAEGHYQNTADWITTILEAPMIHEPATHANYGSANPYLLGVALESVVPEPLEFFMDEHLLAPLGITDYIIQTDFRGHPYFGGGMYLRPRDMLKFGQLYLDKGKLNGQSIISESWIDHSLKKYFTLENREDSIEYGYFWWHKTYIVGKTEIQSMEARGAGGQYIFIIDDLDLVVVITSGNFRNGRFWQPEEILEKYILPPLMAQK